MRDLKFIVFKQPKWHLAVLKKFYKPLIKRIPRAHRLELEVGKLDLKVKQEPSQFGKFNK